MKHTPDHIIYFAPNLEDAYDQFESLLGVRPVFGGLTALSMRQTNKYGKQIELIVNPVCFRTVSQNAHDAG
ncbi:MAG: hypothetical protein AAGD96_05735 [Chloroflexota bacterium]